MFSRAFTFAVLALPMFASAAALVERTDPTGPSNQCNSGSASCCNVVQDSSEATGVIGIIVAVEHIVGNIGLGCLPLLSGGACSSKSVCCTGNTFNGLINIGCVSL